MTDFSRASGILLHPTSLPGPHGIGDLGDAAYRFIDWLAAHQQTLWQTLPLGPTGYGDSPYQTLSAFAGNPNLISLENLIGSGWLTHEDLADLPDFPVDHVDFGAIGTWRTTKLELAYRRFRANDDPDQVAAFTAWCAENEHWLEDYVLYFAIKQNEDLRPWVDWPQGLRKRSPQALTEAAETHADAIDQARFRQWVFYTQWATLRAYTNERGIKIIGDIPIFVAHDSADVWANPDEYYLNDDGSPTFIAGVPPDYFSETGQRWGNPLYRWDVMKDSGYHWWINRFRALLTQADIVRIDHFRGLSEYWQIPGTEETAVNGQWVDGPGADFLEAVRRELGELPIIAEDLGVAIARTTRLREQFGLPGMQILQFAWSDPENKFLPHRHPISSVVYTGTHDNNTTVGWWLDEMDDSGRSFASEYLNNEIIEPHWTMIRVGMSSSGNTFIAPLQDVMGIGSEGRMNLPGTASGNWTWRYTQDMLDQADGEHLKYLTRLYQRGPDQQIDDGVDPAMRSMKIKK